MTGTSAQLQNKVILVTGASSGIGRELCIQLAEQGAQLIITGRARPRLESLETRLKQAAEPVNGPAPILLPVNFEGLTGEDLAAIAEAIKEQFGRLDGLVHCAAASGTHAPLESYRADLWLRVNHVNAQIPVLLTQGLMPLLRASDSPAIAFALDPSADQGQAYWGAYGASKAALRCFCTQLKTELEDSKFAIGGIEMPATLTPGRRQAFPSQNESELATAEASAKQIADFLASSLIR